MDERNRLNMENYENIVLEAEKYDTQDKALKERIKTEVEASLWRKGGREKADDGWEIVPRSCVLEADEL